MVGNKDHNTVLAKRVGYFVLLYYSHKYWSIFKTRESFEVLTFSKHPQHVQFDQGLAKIFEVRLKTNDYILLFS